jgi:hypothetical protein
MERRAVERTKAEIAVSCRIRDRIEQTLTYDISSDGCMLEASNGFCEAGDEIELRFSAATLRGRVVWVKHRNAGVQFDSRAPAEKVAQILAGGRVSLAAHGRGGLSLSEIASYLQLACFGLLATFSAILLVRT